MTTAQIFHMTEAESHSRTETASAVARTVGDDAARHHTVTQGAAEVFQTLSDLRQQEASLWRRLEAAELAMRRTIEGQTWLRLRVEWIRASEKLERAEQNGNSRAMGCDQQADRLRQLVAAGAWPTANDAY